MLSAAAALMRDFPRETMLPLLAIQTPLVIGTILLTVLLYSSVFADEVYPRGGITGATEAGAQVIVLTVIFTVVGGLLAFTIVGLAVIPFLIARFGVAYQVYLLEQTSPIEALTRSWRTMQGNMLRLLGIMVIGLALAFLIGALVPVSPGPESASRELRMAIDAGLRILQGGILIPVAAFAHASITLYYLRIREETP